jgi:nicotinate dehydrogenase subunit A
VQHVITVNGSDHAVDVEPGTSLLDVLRGELGLKSAKFGCGLGQCGACTVLIEDRARSSCDVAVEHVQNQAITTLEGLGSESAPHPLQSSFLETQAAQCGYCIPGIIVSAAALLQAVPQPTRAQVVESLDGNLCRCGSHERIVAAVLAAASR